MEKLPQCALQLVRIAGLTFPDYRDSETETSEGNLLQPISSDVPPELG